MYEHGALPGCVCILCRVSNPTGGPPCINLLGKGYGGMEVWSSQVWRYGGMEGGGMSAEEQRFLLSFFLSHCLILSLRKLV